jgi:hypothetical protein
MFLYLLENDTELQNSWISSGMCMIKMNHVIETN